MSGDFLCLPKESDFIPIPKQANAPKSQVRTSLPYENRSEKFRIPSKDFTNQYFELYSTRLQSLKKATLEKVEKKWGGEQDYAVCSKVLHAAEGKCILVGTLLKNMPLVRRVLDEFTEKSKVGPIPERKNFVSDQDSLVLEDETGRVILTGNNEIKQIVTGMVVAVKGILSKDGELSVEEFCFAGIPAQPKITHEITQDDQYIAFVSGLHISEDVSNRSSISMLVDFLTGRSGSEKESQFASRIKRLVIAGSSLLPPEEQAVVQGRKNKGPVLAEPLEWLDKVLFQLSSIIPVDLMPGQDDPVNVTMPQQPFNPVLFPMSANYKSIHATTNPYEFDFGGLRFLGSSGQTINNIEMYTEIESRCSILEKTLWWRHIAPTAPDNLECFPFKDHDPFILTECPHIYFVGNQPQFEQKTIQLPKGKAKLLCIPEFSKTKQIILVDLKTFQAHPVTFEEAVQDK